ncbi:hypothetical protein BN133_1248 [Cronobacter dublinensis 582]|nr:hypothetical protein BN133_1248 [Cronobacter dublinensis 582]
MRAALNALRQPPRQRHPAHAEKGEQQHDHRQLIGEGERGEESFQHGNAHSLTGRRGKR